MTRKAALLLIPLATLGLALAGCSSDDSKTSCSDAVAKIKAEAATAEEANVHESLVVCKTGDEWVAAVQANPGVLGLEESEVQYITTDLLASVCNEFPDEDLAACK